MWGIFPPSEPLPYESAFFANTKRIKFYVLMLKIFRIEVSSWASAPNRYFAVSGEKQVLSGLISAALSCTSHPKKHQKIASVMWA